MLEQGKFNKILILVLSMIVTSTLVACNIFDNKIQGQIGQASVASPDKKKVSDRIGISSQNPEYLFDEGTRQDIKILLTKATTAETTIQWRVEGGVDDFQVASGSIVLPEKSESFEIPLIAANDGLYEGEEKFNLVIDVDEENFATDLALPLKISEKSATKPQLSFTLTSKSVREDVGTVTVPVKLSQPSAHLIKVKLAVAGTASDGSDFNLSPSQEVVFGPGQTTQNIVFSIIKDGIGGEFLEDLNVSMVDPVEIGTATIDGANKSFSLLIEDIDNGTSTLEIKGVGGGADVNLDDLFLTANANPSVKWTIGAVPSPVLSYSVTIYENNGTSIRCQTGTTGSSPYTFAGCSLIENAVYKISVVANLTNGSTMVAANNMLPFSVDTTAPSSFKTIGAMGGNDIVPDAFLAGSLLPTIVWEDAEGENRYDVKVLYENGTSIDATKCEVTNLPANSTSYTFENCNVLTAGVKYLTRVFAKDRTNLTTPAADFLFTVTSNASGYMILGVTGGSNDTTADENMDDGEAPIVRWQKALGATEYEVKIQTLASADKCTLPSNLSGSISEVTMTGCDLDLNEEYNLVIRANTTSGWLNAANSPYRFKHRVGLYITGSGTGGSYINGQTITTCRGPGNSQCDSTKPYVASSIVNYSKIRISNSGVLSGAEWTGNNATVGNGVLTIRTTDLTLDTSGSISMTKTGYKPTLGPGAGSSGSEGNGGSHGGLGGLTSSGTAGPVYGDAKNPLTMGSGGGNGSGLSPSGGSGGGIIDIEVNRNLTLNGSVKIEANGESGGEGTCSGGMNPTCSGGGGGGAGGSINIVTTNLIGSGSPKIQVNGGGSKATIGPDRIKTSAGGGGRISFRYKQNSLGSLTTVLEALGSVTNTSANASTYSAAGTIFYKNDSTVGGDANGHLLVNNIQPHVQGVETPIPLMTFDSITTLGNGTLIIPSADIYNHPNNIIDFRLVVAGVLNLAVVPNHLKIGTASKVGVLEWRRLDPLVIESVTVEKGSRLTHAKNDLSATYKLVLNTTNLNVYGSIDVSGRGFSIGNGPGRPTGRYGASYGGLGGLGTTGTRSMVYGNIKEPRLLGSGGTSVVGIPTYLAAGGGVVEINTSILRIVGERPSTKTANLGVIKADGLQGQDSGASGGSILINADHVYGKDATITANGGNATYGAGSGGRISIKYKKDDVEGIPGPRAIWSTLSTDPVELIAQGGDGTVDGAAGTLFLQKTAMDGADSTDNVEPADTLGHLWVYNGNRIYDEFVTTLLLESPSLNSIRTDLTGTLQIPSGMSVQLPSNTIGFRLVSEGDFTTPLANDLTISAGGYLEWRKISPLIVNGTFTIDTGGVLTHTKNGSTREYIVSVSATDMNISGKIDARGKGYGPGAGPGAPSNVKWGAAHAGVGADDSSIKKGSGTPYGVEDLEAPFELGSGGFCNRGGGAIRLIADSGTITMNGTVDASAFDASNGCLVTGVYLGLGSGGSIYIKANTLVATKVIGLSPYISVNGGKGGIITGPGSNYAQSGSGGRIAIEVVNDQISDGGLVSAITGNNIMAYGGKDSGDYAAAAGTIVIKRTETGVPKSRLYLNNGTLPYSDRIETPIPETRFFDEIHTLGTATLVVTEGQSFALNNSDLRARLVVAGVFSSFQNKLNIKSGGYLQWRRSTPLVLEDLVIESGGKLTHTSNFADQQYRLELNLKNLDIQAGGEIDVSEKGFQPKAGSGGSTTGAAAYGGNSRTALAYGSVMEPLDLGSGGAIGAGGGSVQIKVSNQATIAGKILANGGSGANAGAGGSVFLDVGDEIVNATIGELKLVSGFEISAKGGDGTVESGTGGRISIRYEGFDTTGGVTSVEDETTQLKGYKINAQGGPSSDVNKYGAAGTIYYVQKPYDALTNKGTLILKNGTNPYHESATTPLPDGSDFAAIVTDTGVALEVRQGESVKLPSTLRNRLILGGSVNTGGTLTIESGGVLEIRRGTVVKDFNTIIVKNGGVLTHTSNSVAKTYVLDLEVTDLDLQSGGQINVDGKGFSGGNGPGAGCDIFNSGLAGGGTFAGFGHVGTVTSCNRAAYGSIKDPIALGSGGGNKTYAFISGGSGGGLVKLNVKGDLTINGTISANGNQGTCAASICTGSGSGGAVNILTVNLLGTSGSIFADGGIKITGTTEMASGGGGRIALKVSGADSHSGLTALARGGSSTSVYPAAAGTVYRSVGADPLVGSLTISNEEASYVTGNVTELFVNEAFTSVTIGKTSFERNTGVSVRKGTLFDFQLSAIKFPLILDGTARFLGYNFPVLGNIDIQNGGILDVRGDQQVEFGTVTVRSGGKLTHGANNTSVANVLNLKATTLLIENNGFVDVSEKGYSAKSGPGAGVSATISNLSGGGASFGGVGGGGGSAHSAGVIYGNDALTALTVGSGGGSSFSCQGSSGGGGVFLNIGTLTINSGGAIKANGGDATNVGCYSGGGGSGGAVRIVVDTITTDMSVSDQRIFARGGSVNPDSPGDDGFDDGGAGGGGRVSIQYRNLVGLDATDVNNWISVTGGSKERLESAPGLNGAEGTKSMVLLP